MKFIFLFFLMISSVSFADELGGTHWQLKSIRCETGVSPQVPDSIQYNWYFPDSSKVEIAIMRPDDWNVARGDYSVSNTNHLCLNLNEEIISGKPVNTKKDSWCGTFDITARELNFTWVVTSPNGGDCAPNVPVTATFEKKWP